MGHTPKCKDKKCLKISEENTKVHLYELESSNHLLDVKPRTEMTKGKIEYMNIKIINICPATMPSRSEK